MRLPGGVERRPTPGATSAPRPWSRGGPPAPRPCEAPRSLPDGSVLVKSRGQDAEAGARRERPACPWGAGPGRAPRALDGVRLLTHGEAHQAVGEEAGGQEGGPERDVQLLRGLGLHPHEQAARETGVSGGGARPGRARGGRTYFLIFSRMSAILPKRFCGGSTASGQTPAGGPHGDAGRPQVQVQGGPRTSSALEATARPPGPPPPRLAPAG